MASRISGLVRLGLKRETNVQAGHWFNPRSISRQRRNKALRKA